MHGLPGTGAGQHAAHFEYTCAHAAKEVQGGRLIACMQRRTCDCNDQRMVLAVSAQEHFLTLLDLQVTSSQGQYVSSSLDTLLSWKHTGAVTDIKVCSDSMEGVL